MPNLFGGNAGRIRMVLSGDDFYMPLGLVVGDFKARLGVKGLLTGMMVTGQSGHQVMHTLRQYIYVYTFGERVGSITVTGLAFMQDCTADGSGASGLARIADWYSRNSISNSGESIAITLTPGFAVRAFLVDFKYQVEDPSISLGQFAMQFFYPPNIPLPGSVSPFSIPSLTGIAPTETIIMPPAGP